MEIIDVKIELVKETENYRGKVDDVSGLMASIKENGLLQPITVEKKKKGYELVFGNRRIKAVKSLGLKTIKAIVAPKGANRIILNVIENMQREDVSMYEVGRAVNQLVVNDKMTPNEICIKLGVKTSYVKAAINAFNITPVKYRNKVVSVDIRKNKSKGLIASTVSSNINITASRFGLTKKHIDDFYKLASEKQLSNSHIRTIAHLLNNGRSFIQAKKEYPKTKLFRTEIFMDKDKYDFLIDKHGKSFVQTMLKNRIK